MKGLIFTYVLTFGGAATSLFSPFYGLLVYVCFAIIKPEDMWPWSVPAGNYSRIVALAMLAGWLADGGGTRALSMLYGWLYEGSRCKLVGKSWPIVLIFVLYFGWTLIEAMFASHQQVAWEYVETLAKIVLPFIVGVTTITRVSQVKQLAWTIVVSQGYVAYEANLSYFRGYNQLAVSGFGGMDNNCVAIALVTALGLAFFLAVSSGRIWQKAVAFGLALLMIHAILFSYSRGGMLAAVVAGFTALVLIPKRPKQVVALLVALVLAVQLAGPEIRDRFVSAFARDTGPREASAQSRLDLWADCWDVMKSRPILGAGPDHWPLIAHEYGWPRGKEAHSLWMQTGAELGFVGVLLLIGLYTSTIVCLYPLCRSQGELTDPWIAGGARMVITALTGFMLAAQFVSLEALEIPYYVVLLGAALLIVRSVNDGQFCEQDSGRPERCEFTVI